MVLEYRNKNETALVLKQLTLWGKGGAAKNICDMRRERSPTRAIRKDSL